MDWAALSATWLEQETDVEAAHKVVLDGLMARANLQPGESVLDIGCGSGSSTLRALKAVGADGQVLAVEIAPPLAARTIERVRGPVQVQVGDAQTHRFDPKSVDAAISLFGTMFFADSVAAFANIRTAMRPGGRMHLAAWGAPARNDWFAIGRRIATAHLGAGTPPDPTAPGPFAFADSARVLGMLDAAGWQARVETVDTHLLPRGTVEDVANVQTAMGAAAMMLAEKEGSEQDRIIIAAALKEAFEGLTRDGQIHVPAQIHYFSATVKS